MSNLKIIVDKILNKDKEYNQTISKITEKESAIDKLKADISTLENEYRELKSNCKFILLICCSY